VAGISPEYKQSWWTTRLQQRHLFNECFTPDQAALLQQQADGRTARVSVRDRGPGLASEEQQYVWERFRQIECMTSHSDTGTGLGLGLYICRSIIERHHGEVGVESTPGKGATFWFTLPLTSIDKEYAYKSE
jgi:signal transduction histidine kinase